MDHKIELNTGEQGISIVRTSKIKGNLSAFIIKLIENEEEYGYSSSVSIRILSELGYVLLDLAEFNGTEYFPPRVQGKDFKGWGTVYSNYEYNLNENLNIRVMGGKNKKVNIIIRTE